MKLTRDTIDHLAHLARIRLTDDEKSALIGDLSRILDYVNQLSAVDTTGVEPLVSVVDKPTPLRPDVPVPGLTQADALRNAPEKNSDYFKVPKVLNT